MSLFNLSNLEYQFGAIEVLITEIIKSDTISDKKFENLKAKIGHFDDCLANADNSDQSSKQVSKLKKKVESIYDILDRAHHNKEEGQASTPIGDYYGDDNSFILSGAVKSALLTIIIDKE